MPDWDEVKLPDTWPDLLRLHRPMELWRLLRGIIGPRRRVSIPTDMPGAQELPRYVLQEFHHLPNGNYSKRFTEGYIAGFDRAMLGRMSQARRGLAEYLRGSESVLDVGTAGGATAAVLHEQGVPDVWGIDPSPYLLQHAARRHRAVRFVQGIAEQLPFGDHRFDGVSVCFTLHELPPKHVKRTLAEIRRVLKPRGRLAICEPGASQRDDSAWTLLKREGLVGPYFRLLATSVHEPFVQSWHRLDMPRLLRETGFELCRDDHRYPVRYLFASA